MHYIRPGATGSNNGSDWVNAYTSLPSNLVRGDTYYLADGSYGSYTFDDSVSGTTLITVKKATTEDHGTATGWNSSYGDGQAIFKSWVFSSDYYYIDGQTRNQNWQTGAIDQYGIRVKTRGIVVRFDNGAGVGGDFITLRRVDMEAGGRDSGAGDDVIYGLNGSKYITFSECALHDSDRTIFLLRGSWQNLLVEYCYIARNASSPAIHGEILSHVGSDYVTFRYNIIEDPEGTAVWASLNGGGSKSASNTAANWKIYGNVILHSESYKREGISGVIFAANDASNKNWMDNLKFYNNTLINIKGLWSGICVQAGSANEVMNNIWYNCVNAPMWSVTTGYNWYYNTPNSNDTNPTKQVCTSNCNIFANLTTKDYTLNGNNLPDAGYAFSTPFDEDMYGTVRGSNGLWDRGAFEFPTDPSSSPGTGPLPQINAPRNLRIVSQE